MFWNDEKIERQRNYLANERIERRGNFTEFVVRTYYCIYKACSLNDGACCLASDVSAYKIKFIIYDGIYHTPDHDNKSVIDDCVKKLKLMYYIKFKKENEKWMIYINKPLDFLLPNEHEQYLERFQINNSVKFLSEIK